MDPIQPNPRADNFEDHPRLINYVYNQLDQTLDTKLPQEKIKPEKYLLVGVFFFFAVGIVISLILLVNNISREQKANSVAAEAISITPSTPSPN